MIGFFPGCSQLQRDDDLYASFSSVESAFFFLSFFLPSAGCIFEEGGGGEGWRLEEEVSVARSLPKSKRQIFRHKNGRLK